MPVKIEFNSGKTITYVKSTLEEFMEPIEQGNDYIVINADGQQRHVIFLKNISAIYEES